MCPSLLVPIQPARLKLKRRHQASTSRRSTRLLPIDDPALVAVELHAAERTTLVVVTDRIGLEFRLFGHGMLAELLGAAGRAIAEFVGAMVVPPGALVEGGTVEDLEMDIGMFEPDPAELNEIFRLQPDRQPAL